MQSTTALAIDCPPRLSRRAFYNFPCKNASLLVGGRTDRFAKQSKIELLAKQLDEDEGP